MCSISNLATLDVLVVKTEPSAEEEKNNYSFSLESGIKIKGNLVKAFDIMSIKRKGKCTHSLVPKIDFVYVLIFFFSQDFTEGGSIPIHFDGTKAKRYFFAFLNLMQIMRQLKVFSFNMNPGDILCKTPTLQRESASST